MIIDHAQLDSETRVREGDHVALRTWLRLLTCCNMIEGELRRRFRVVFDCTLPRFDLLAQLDRHPEGLTMGQLTELMMVSGGNVTGLVTQLEERGWVARSANEHDRRSFRVRLTRSGAREFARMAEVHEGWVTELLGNVPEVDQEQLLKGLRALKGSVRDAIANCDDAA